MEATIVEISDVILQKGQKVWTVPHGTKMSAEMKRDPRRRGGAVVSFTQANYYAEVKCQTEDGEKMVDIYALNLHPDWKRMTQVRKDQFEEEVYALVGQVIQIDGKKVDYQTLWDLI